MCALALSSRDLKCVLSGMTAARKTASLEQTGTPKFVWLTEQREFVAHQFCLRTLFIMVGSTLLGLMMIPLVWGQLYPIPPTCYSKVLTMGREITQRAAEIKKDYDTERCAAHLPDLYIDVHNACVLFAMNSYLSLLGGLRERRCGYTRKVQALGSMIRQLRIIIFQKCHGELVFTYDNCAALERRRG
ncbi:hypothetical protein NFI96_033808 [Prochilodus magdalenae]|nr:hypothetical protein NFI96_033808 [Prochilodus magdalenae]